MACFCFFDILYSSFCFLGQGFYLFVLCPRSKICGQFFFWGGLMWRARLVWDGFWTLKQPHKCVSWKFMKISVQCISWYEYLPPILFCSYLNSMAVWSWHFACPWSKTDWCYDREPWHLNFRRTAGDYIFSCVTFQGRHKNLCSCMNNSLYGQ